jgi:hypothetical protein
MYAFEQRMRAEGMATYYRLRYRSEIWTCVLSVDNDGNSNGFSLRRSPRYNIYKVCLREVVL